MFFNQDNVILEAKNEHIRHLQMPPIFLYNFHACMYALRRQLVRCKFKSLSLPYKLKVIRTTNQHLLQTQTLIVLIARLVALVFVWDSFDYKDK